MAKKVLFIKFGGFSQINEKIAHLLQKKFPECDIHIVDMYDVYKKNKMVMLINLFFFLKEYGADILFGYKDFVKLKASFFLTSYFFNKVKAKAAELHQNDLYSFSFQTQSLFDCSYSKVPHFIYTDHTLRANFYYPKLDIKAYLKPKAYMEKVDHQIYQNATMIFTYSNFVKNSLIKQYQIPSEKIEVVGVGPNVPVNISKPLSNKLKKNILFVGVNWKRKGGDLLLEAFRKVLVKIPDATLTVVGCTPEVADESIKNNVHVVGKVPLDEVAKYYLDASIFCLPTQREPFGVVFLEAFAYGLPVVATDIAAIPEFVHEGENGFLIQNNNAEELSERLIYLLDNPNKCKELGENGRSLVGDVYDWDIVGRKISEKISESVYKKNVIKKALA